MNETEIFDYARRLFEAHGGKAEAEAVQKEQAAKDAGKPGEAEDWNRIRLAIRQLKA